MNIYFDIETGPVANHELLHMLPEFDEAEVKLGNLKDPEKIQQKLDEARANHESNFIKKAALDPISGRVLAIGVTNAATGEFSVLGAIGEQEVEILNQFWDLCVDHDGQELIICGFNTHQFVLPFLIRRSWKHSISIPAHIRRGRYWSDKSIDIRERWTFGDRHASGSLDTIAKYFGFTGKTGNGADFADKWEHYRDEAIDYIKADLDLTRLVALRMGFGREMGDKRQNMPEVAIETLQPPQALRPKWVR